MGKSKHDSAGILPRLGNHQRYVHASYKGSNAQGGMQPSPHPIIFVTRVTPEPGCTVDANPTGRGRRLHAKATTLISDVCCSIAAPGIIAGIMQVIAKVAGMQAVTWHVCEPPHEAWNL